MLILQLKKNETVRVDGPAVFVHYGNQGGRTKIGVEADRSVNIRRVAVPSESAEDDSAEQ
jgi:sRNA-binding carbon storage regulator CsrA